MPDPRSRKERQRQKRRKAMIARAIAIGVLVVIIAIAAAGITLGVKQASQARVDQKAEIERQIQAEEIANVERQNKIDEAERVAVEYDYDKAIELLKSIEGYDKDANIISAIAKYEAIKSTLIPVNIDHVTHIFYHSLVVDPVKGFTGNDDPTRQFRMWMTTIDEFNAVTQEMYNNGYVIVALHDLVNQTVDDDGQVHFTKANIYLPEGKKPVVISMDDLSYYHSYDGRGVASKMIIGEDGKPTCEYIEDDGTVSVGDYDYVPLLDKFIEEHPDAAYKGAKATIALTGYNGILGYRTDIAYKTKENLTKDQQEWLDAHPDFDWDREREEATKVAEAIKANGWTFASHTWGHMHIGDASLERIKTDTEKWQEYVAPLVGETDIIVFAHGQDIASWHDYTMDNPKFEYLKSKGFNIFCNVDAAQYYVQARDSYLRMGRRNIDGTRLWPAANGGDDKLSDLFDASKVIDHLRPQTDVP